MKKINNKSIKTILAMAVMLSLWSCQDFLEEANPNQLSTGTFWKNLSDMETGLVSVYAALRHRDLLSFREDINRSDQSWATWKRPATEDIYFLFTYNESSAEPTNKWAALYRGIWRANQVIEAYDNLLPTFNESQKETADLILAQARFLRGLFHFYLHGSFNGGEVIIYDSTPKTIEEFNKGTSSPDEVQAFFREDLEFAAENLPAKWELSADLGRVTAGAAEAVLGKSFLYEGEYDMALEYFRNVINNPEYGYALTENIGDNFSALTEFNSESILEISYSSDEKTSEGSGGELGVANTMVRWFAPESGKGGWGSISPANWLILAYREDKPDTTDVLNLVKAKSLNGTEIPASGGGDSLVVRKFSIRASKSIAMVDDVDELYYGDLGFIDIGFNRARPAYFRKHTNSDHLTTELENVPVDRSGVNIRLIRLADVYLMYAEALIKGGTDESGVEEAMKYINRVRRRSRVVLLGPNGSGEYSFREHDNKTYTASQLMDHLMYVERPVELSVEGHAGRFNDLRRWGITKQRFEDLRISMYRSDSYQTTHPETGVAISRWGCIPAHTTDVAETHPDWYTCREPQAANFIPEVHNYYALPTIEMANNTGLITGTN